MSRSRGVWGGDHPRTFISTSLLGDHSRPRVKEHKDAEESFLDVGFWQEKAEMLGFLFIIGTKRTVVKRRSFIQK